MMVGSGRLQRSAFKSRIRFLCTLVALFHLRFASAEVELDDTAFDKDAKKESMESTIMCTFDGRSDLDIIDWTFYFELLKKDCQYAEVEFRVLCGPEATWYSSGILGGIADMMKEQEYNLLCPNGVVQAAAIAIAHNTTYNLQYRWVLAEALQKSYVLDNSKWHVKAIDALELLQNTYDRGEYLTPGTRAFDNYLEQQARNGIQNPKELLQVANERIIQAGGDRRAKSKHNRPAIEKAGREIEAWRLATRLQPGTVTILLPYGFPSEDGSGGSKGKGTNSLSGKVDFLESPTDLTKIGSVIYPDKMHESLGRKLNKMIEKVETEYTLVVASEYIFPTAKDIENLMAVFEVDDGYLSALSFSGLDSDRRIIDFCWSLQAKHWKLKFSRDYWSYVIRKDQLNPTMTGSDVYNEDGTLQIGSSVRGSTLFASHEMQSCKTCHTIAPTFLARTAALREGAPFRVSLDGEWALVDWFLRRSWHERLEHGFGQCVGGYLKINPLYPGTQRDAAASKANNDIASNSYSAVTSKADSSHLTPPLSEWKHLYGHPSDVNYFFSSRLSLNFKSWGAGLMPVGSKVGIDLLAKEFMEKNDLKEITTIDGENHHFGCTLRSTNCPMDWLYKGWAVPPCCRRTLRDVLFYADDLFHEFGIKYIVTDGALLGALKTGSLLDWDADIDLHIENEGFKRLESLRPIIEKAGYGLRAHERGESFLLTANKQNYLYLELNLRSEKFPDEPWFIELEGRWFPTLDHPGRNATMWYGEGIYTHRVRYVPPWEEDAGNYMFCGPPNHHNCVSDVPSGKDCHRDGPCKIGTHKVIDL